jgi:hypothetical protein
MRGFEEALRLVENKANKALLVAGNSAAVAEQARVAADKTRRTTEELQEAVTTRNGGFEGRVKTLETRMGTRLHPQSPEAVRRELDEIQTGFDTLADAFEASATARAEEQTHQREMNDLFISKL